MIKVKNFKNNVRFVYEKIPHVRTISLGVWFDNGSIHETQDENGISHFIEHMLFKGTNKRSQKELAELIDNVGGIQNAFTSKEFTCYYIRALDSYFDLCIDVLADMVFNSKFDEEEIERERKVIIEEIKMYEDLPDDLVAEKFNENIFKDSSYARPILGTEETLHNIDRAKFMDYLNRRYCGENIVISLAGNFDEKDVLEKVESYFGTKIIGTNDNKIVEKPKFQSQIVKTQKDIEQAHLIIGYEGLDYFDKNSLDLNIFSSIFGGTMSSTLNQIIREKYGYAYSIYSTNISSKNTGIFSVYAGLNKENINHVVEIVKDEFNNYVKNPITPERLKNAKEQFKSQFLMSLENTNNCMTRNGRNLVAKNKVYSDEDIIKKIDAVSIDSIQETISKIYTDTPAISMVGDVNDIKIGER